MSEIGYQETLAKTENCLDNNGYIQGPIELEGAARAVAVKAQGRLKITKAEFLMMCDRAWKGERKDFPKEEDE